MTEEQKELAEEVELAFERMRDKRYEPTILPIEVLSDLVSQRDAEITALRELVRWVRERYETMSCGCSVLNDYLCERCTVLERIDTDLAEIGGKKHG